MTFLKNKKTGKFLTKEGNFVTILELNSAIRFEYFITAVQKLPKLEEIVGVKLVTCNEMEVIDELIKLERSDRDSIYEGGLREQREKIQELLKENEQLKKHIKYQGGSF